MPDEEWATEFYVEENGTSPVEEFLNQLDMRTLARFRWSMEQLRLRNVLAREPLVRHLEHELWELREESSASIYRIVYFFFAGRRIVFLHGFQKKTQKTPAREIAVARKRAMAFQVRQEVR
jgi:phage-related protein